MNCLTVDCDNIVRDRSTVIGEIDRYRDRIGGGHFWVTRGRVSSQGKAVVNCRFTINLGTNFQLINYKPLYIIWAFTASVFQIYWSAMKQTNVT